MNVSVFLDAHFFFLQNVNGFSNKFFFHWYNSYRVFQKTCNSFLPILKFRFKRGLILGINQIKVNSLTILLIIEIPENETN